MANIRSKMILAFVNSEDWQDLKSIKGQREILDREKALDVLFERIKKCAVDSPRPRSPEGNRWRELFRLATRRAWRHSHLRLLVDRIPCPHKELKMRAERKYEYIKKMTPTEEGYGWH